MPLQIVRTVKGLGRVDSRPATFLPPDHYGCGLGCACFTGTLAAVEEHERGCLHFLEPLLPEGLDRDICNGDADEQALNLRDIIEPLQQPLSALATAFLVDVEGLEDKFPLSAVFGGADPMAAIFLVDRTWQPILDSTIDAVSMVFSDYINYHDRFGMYGLGDGWIVPLALKTSINIDDIESAKVCVGACILYKSMLDCLKVLSAVKGHSKWLVVLSDTVDLEERVNSAALAAGDSAVVVNPNNAGCKERF